MKYPEELEFTPLEEHYIRARIDFDSPSEVLTEAMESIGGKDMSSFDDVEDLESRIREGQPYFNECTIDTIMSEEEKDNLRFKLDGRLIFRIAWEKQVRGL